MDEGFRLLPTLVSITIITFCPGLLNVDRIIHSAAPILSGNYWYFCTYILLLTCATPINKLVSSWGRRRFRTILICGGAIITVLLGLNPYIITSKYIGPQYSLVWFVFVYLLGAYIRLYGIGGTRCLWALLLLSVSVIELLLGAVFC